MPSTIKRLLSKKLQGKFSLSVSKRDITSNVNVDKRQVLIVLPRNNDVKSVYILHNVVFYISVFKVSS